MRARLRKGWWVLAVGVLAGPLLVTGWAQQAVSTFGDRFVFSNTRCTLVSGSGSPETVTTGSPCDVYVRADASPTVSSIYVKLSGVGTKTGWVVWTGQSAVRTVVAVTTSRNLSVSDAEKVFTNTGATATTGFVLPTAASCVGCVFTFTVTAAYTFNVWAAGGEYVRVDTAQGSSGGRLYATTAGSAVTVASVGLSGQWVVVSSVGTWTQGS